MYVTRQYRLHHGARGRSGELADRPVAGFPGYLAIAFLHDSGTFSITFIHDGSDKRLRRLRHDDVFDDAVRAIPRLAEWIEPTRS